MIWSTTLSDSGFRLFSRNQPFRSERHHICHRPFHAPADKTTFSNQDEKTKKVWHYLNTLPTFLPWLCCLPFWFLIHHFFFRFDFLPWLYCLPFMILISFIFLSKRHVLWCTRLKIWPQSKPWQTLFSRRGWHFYCSRGALRGDSMCANVSHGMQQHWWWTIRRRLTKT